MRFIKNGILLFVLTFVVPLNGQNIKGIDAESVICKEEIKKYLKDSLNGFKEDFIFTGKSAALNDLNACILMGRKKDSIYDILMVTKNCDVIKSKTIPTATYYMKKGSIIREFVLSNVYIGLDRNSDCIKINIDDYNLMRVDTLKNKFSFNFHTPVAKDSILVCHSKCHEIDK